MLSAVAAYLIWGFSPLYWKMLADVDAFEIILHRVVWSFVLLFLLVMLLGRGGAFWRVLKTPRHLGIFATSALLVASNWFLYIWSVNHAHVLQASMGYYINPLVSVLLGMLFLKERLRPAQMAAFGLACAGVMYMTLQYGRFPWIALALAFTFGFYALIRKTVPVAPLVGLTVEMLILTVPAAIVLGVLFTHQSGAFLHQGQRTDLLLMVAALFTALPLLLFSLATKRLNLATIGFLQYIAPTAMFFLGVFVYQEPFARTQVITFILIWSALGLYLFDSLRTYRRVMG